MLETSARNVLIWKIVKTKKLLYVREVQREQRELYRDRETDWQRDRKIMREICRKVHDVQDLRFHLRVSINLIFVASRIQIYDLKYNMFLLFLSKISYAILG